jgi:hypothetical protein
MPALSGLIVWIFAMAGLVFGSCDVPPVAGLEVARAMVSWTDIRGDFYGTE